MGRVYRAVQQPLGREVALKVLDLEQLQSKTAGGDFAKRFFMEAAACAKLSHPNTVVVYDYGKIEDDEIFYIAMELLRGRTLDDVVEDSAPMDPAVTIHVALQICGSLGEAHDSGMVHRDLKPSNVMLTMRGADQAYVKVLDFGLVKDDNDAGLTQSGALLGTPRYIAPEQIANSNVGPASDIYSLGACMYHMLTGRPPFDSDSKFVLLASHINVQPPGIHEVVPDSSASPEFAAIVMRCLSKDPKDRFPSMEALAQAVLNCPEDTSTSATMLARSSTSQEMAVPDFSDTSATGARIRAARKSADGEVGSSGIRPPMDAMTPAPAVSATRPRRTGMWIALAAILVGAIGTAAFVILQSQPIEAPAETETTGTETTGTETQTATGIGMATTGTETTGTETTGTETTGTETTGTETTGTETALVQPVELTTDPPARVRRGALDLGDTPLTLPIPAGESWQIVLTADGFETRELTVLAGQGEVRVSLTRRRRAGMQTREVVETMAVEQMTAMDPETPMTMTTTMSEPTTMTDNRDPWAQ
jgi:serine/threonine-protein kinase